MIDFFGIPQAIARRMDTANKYALRRIGEDIARIGSLNNYKDAQLIAVRMTGESIAEITRELSKASGMTESDIEKLYADAARYDYEFAEQFYTADNPQIPYRENEALQRTVKAMTKAAQDNCYNLSHSYAFALRDRDGRVRYTSLAAGYKECIDKAITAVKTGVSDYKTEMRRVLKQYADSGVRVVDWESGYSQRIDTAVRRNIMDGLRQVKNETQALIGQEFGANGYEISAHMNPAPDHADIQGRQYSFEEFNELNESLERPIGTLNCYHTKTAIILGISRPTYTEEQLQEMKHKSNELIDIDSKKYTRYQCTQLQRQIETKIRKQKDRKEILKAAGDDVGVRECNRKIRLLKDKYNEISQKAGLDAHYDRMSITKSGKNVDFDPLSAIIKREKFSAYERIESGELPLSLNTGNQNKHIQSSHSFKPDDKKSVLYGDLETAQKLVDKYHGKGKLKFTSRGKWTNKELVTADTDIGIVFDPETGEAKPTNRFAIHYGKKGTHVVPMKREDKK